MKYFPRGDYVLCRIERVDKSEGGIVIPSVSQQGNKWRVVAFGPDVKGLNAGDEVQLIGAVGEDIVPLPREKDLWLTKESNIVYVVAPEGTVH